VTALVLDFGGPVLRTPFELLRGSERRLGLAEGSLPWTGPFDPSADADWQRMQAHEITERDYWQRKADEFAALTGREASFRGLMDELFDAPEDDLVRPEARRLAEDARAAGVPVAVCTNDMQAFHGLEWVQQNQFLKLVDVLVDGSIEHILKPDPRIYLMVTARLGLEPGECVFVDDQPGNIAGAQDVGMRTVWFDVTHPDTSYAEARAALGIEA
jgi:putative hydrolase of the HAD superfamily